jgi:predicted  nucleic acid-binding Zn-ribbon protein
MSEQFALLYELQLADTGVTERKRALAGLDDGTKARGELAAAEERLAVAEKKLHDDQATLKDKELRLSSTEHERREKHSQAYSGTIADPKRLAALEQKIAELERLRGKLEEEAFALMDQIEQEAAGVGTMRDETARLRARAEDVEEHYRMDKTRLEGEIADLGKRREELAAQIGAPLLQMYEQLRGKLGGTAVAPVDDFRCKVCHNSVPRDVVTRIPRSETPIRCESCHRILWVPEGEE